MCNGHMRVSIQTFQICLLGLVVENKRGKDWEIVIGRGMEGLP